MLLASVARGWDSQTSRFVGEIRLWDVEKNKQVAEPRGVARARDLGRSLAVYATGNQPQQACVVTFGLIHVKEKKEYYGTLRLWDVEKNKLQEEVSHSRRLCS